MAYFRTGCGFFSHVKTKKLKRDLGYEGIVSLMMLWSYAAANDYIGEKEFTVEEIELAVDWDRKNGDLVAVLISSGFLDQQSNGVILLHDWDEHQGS